MAAELREAIALLQRRRDAARAEVAKYEKALAALLALEDEEGGESPEAAGHSALVPTPIPVPRPSVLTMAKTLLDQEDRVWTVAAIISEYEKRGTPVQAADPANALRTALSTLVKRGDAYRESAGYFRSTQFRQESAGAESDREDEAEMGGLRLAGS